MRQKRDDISVAYLSTLCDMSLSVKIFPRRNLKVFLRRSHSWLGLQLGGIIIFWGLTHIFLVIKFENENQAWDSHSEG